MILGLLGLVVLTAQPLWLGKAGVPQVRSLGGVLEGMRRENAQREARNAKLHAEVEDLKAGGEAIEEFARQELGMVGQGEIFIRFSEPLPSKENQVLEGLGPSFPHGPSPALDLAAASSLGQGQP